MNFVDELLDILGTLSAVEVIETVTVMWADTTHGITEEQSMHYPVFMQDLLHIIDFDTVCNRDGLENFVKYNDTQGYAATIKAFERCGYVEGAEILATIRLQKDVCKRQQNGHGKLSKETLTLIESLENKFYYERVDTEFWQLVEQYVENEKHKPLYPSERTLS